MPPSPQSDLNPVSLVSDVMGEVDPPAATPAKVAPAAKSAPPSAPAGTKAAPTPGAAPVKTEGVSDPAGGGVDAGTGELDERGSRSGSGSGSVSGSGGAGAAPGEVVDEMVCNMCKASGSVSLLVSCGSLFPP